MAKPPRGAASMNNNNKQQQQNNNNYYSNNYDQDFISNRKAECRGVINALNSQFCKHLLEQNGTNLSKSWAEGCADYITHINKLMEEYKDVLEEEEEEKYDNNKSKDNKNDSEDSDDGGNGKPKKNSIFGSFPSSFQPQPIQAGVEKKSNPFGGFSSAPGTFSLFPSTNTTAIVGSGASSFQAKSGAVAKEDNEDGGDDEEPERPPSPSTLETNNCEDEKEFVDMEKLKVKLYVKKNVADPWSDRGVNKLQFRREKEGSGTCRILMRTSIGKAVLNANMYENVSVSFAEQKDKRDGSIKKIGVILTIFNACENNEKQIIFLKLGSTDAVEELQRLIVKNTRK